MKKKRIHKSKNTTNQILKRWIWGFIALLALIGFIGVGYYIGYVEASKLTEKTTPASKDVSKKEEILKETPKKDLPKQEHQEPVVKEEKLPEMPKHPLSQKDEDDFKERLKSVLNAEQNKYAQKGASHEYEGTAENLNRSIKEEPAKKPEQAPKEREKTPKKSEKKAQKEEHVAITKKSEQSTTTGKAKLAIIIDDVSFDKEVSALKKLNLTLTMSFLPPNKLHPDSADLAAKESFYMVHLPMEAVSFTGNEPLTLNVDDSQAVISQRLDDVVKLFPRVKYINNHTGSKFTSNEVAMNKLIFSLKQHNIEFIDSRTIAQTKAPKVMNAFGERYIGRDVFLDHTMDIASVKKQIAEAVKVAKKRGYAVAIGHPHPNTLAALRASKDILSEVELVQINRI
jgi:hypothetical protein